MALPEVWPNELCAAVLPSPSPVNRIACLAMGRSRVSCRVLPVRVTWLQSFPATPMVPFVVEALGRLSPEAHALLGAVAPADKKVRSQVLRTAKQTLSVLVQTGLAELLLSAEPGRGVPAPAAAAA